MIVLDLVNFEVTVLMLVAKSVTTFVAVELTIGIVVAGMVIVGVNLVCVSLIFIRWEQVYQPSM